MAVMVSFTLQSLASADSNQNIGIAPAIISKGLDPGSSTSDSLDITNFGVSSYSYTIYASPYGAASENYQPVFKKLPGFTTISSWFSFENDRGYLAPGQTAVINYSINVPLGTAPGSYYAAVFAETSSSAQPAKKDQVQLVQRVGTLFYINVTGKAYENGSINSWHVPLFQSSPVVGSLKLANGGKLYYVSNVSVNFRDILGNVKYTFETQKIVIPKVVRNIPITWPKPPILGLYKVNGTVTIYGQKHLSTHYVFIMSDTVRWVFAIVIVSFIIYLGVQNIFINLYGSKSSKRQKK
jgi:hypothetical protein